jgi:hypothetical protein
MNSEEDFDEEEEFDEEGNEALDNLEETLSNLANVELPEGNKATIKFDTKRLIGILEQYLDPFIVFGYDLDGRNIILTNRKNQRDCDALSLSVDRFSAMEMDDDVSGNMEPLG